MKIAILVTLGFCLKYATNFTDGFKERVFYKIDYWLAGFTTLVNLLSGWECPIYIYLALNWAASNCHFTWLTSSLWWQLKIYVFICKLDGIGIVDNRPSKLASPLCPDINDMWHMTCHMWHMACHMWHMTCHMWHVTFDTQHGTHDTWQVGVGENSLKILAPYLLQLGMKVF